MAINTLERMTEYYSPPIYCFHEVVHNRSVVSSFERRGVVFVDSIEQVPCGARLVFSAHGVSPAVREAATARSLKVVDLTCPLVLKVHREAREFAAQGRRIALVGHADHDEVVGVMGEAPEQIVLVQNIDQARMMETNGHTRFAYLTQTTLSIDETRGILETLKERFSDITGPAAADICYATQNRQEAITALARESDVVLVVGSTNSSNTMHLVNVAKLTGKPVHRIEDASDLRMEWFEGADIVALTAGASAPELVVQEVISYFRIKWDAHVDERVVKFENVHFPPPHGLLG